MTSFSVQIIDMVFRVIRSLLKYSTDIKAIIFSRGNKDKKEAMSLIVGMLDLDY